MNDADQYPTKNCLGNRETVMPCVEGRGVEGQNRIELLEEEEREKTTSIVAFQIRFQF